MGKEYETKILDIEPIKIIAKLEKLGAKKVLDCTYKRWVFDMGNQEWIRLRTNGEETTLTYKSKSGDGIDETKEVETIVENFNLTYEIISKLKFKGTYYHENERIMYKLNDIEYCIDTWANIPTYLEIESYSCDKVEEGLRLLGLEGKDFGNKSVIDVYAFYDVDMD